MISVVLLKVAKQYVGDMIERAKIIQFEEGRTGPLSPDEIQAVFFAKSKEGKVPSQYKKSRLFM